MLLRDKNKKGVSEIIGYVLLIAFAVVIGAVTYTWLRTYVPSEPLACPDSVSLFVQNSNYCGNQLNLTIRNKGRFDVAGYFILATNSLSQTTLASIDLSQYLNESFSGKKVKNAIIGNQVMFLYINNNSFTLGNTTTNVFDIPSELGNILSVQIIPSMFQQQNNRNMLARCNNAKIIEKGFTCYVPPPPCVPATDPTLTGVCGTTRVCGTQQNGTCGTVTCGTCTGVNVCNSVGQCIPPAQCTDTCATYGYQCGTWTICGNSVICGSGCASGFKCSATGQCVLTGTCDPGATCTIPACEGKQADCKPNYLCRSGSCVLDTTGVTTCQSYCQLLGYGYSQCINGGSNPSAACSIANGGIYQSGGNQYCTPVGTSCCCLTSQH